jgi:hypothetical protein
MLKRLVGKKCGNPNCANTGVLVPADLHVCDICAEPLLPVKEWNRGVTLTLSGLLVAGVVSGILFIHRPPPPPPPCCLPPTPQEITLAFSLEAVGDAGAATPLPPEHSFRSGDRFRVILRPDFDAYVYLFNQNPADQRVAVLYPPSPNATAVQANAESRAPGAQAWFRMDDKSGSEVLILVASPKPLPQLDWANGSLARQDFESWLATTEREGKPKSQQSFVDDNWTKLMAEASQDPIVFVHRIPLKHE